MAVGERWVRSANCLTSPPSLGVFDEARLFCAMSRAHSPHLSTLGSPLPLARSHFLWPFFRYMPLLDRAASGRLGLIAGLWNLDDRKRSIIAEDFGLGLSVLQLGLMGVPYFLTKWELGNPVMQAWLEALLKTPPGTVAAVSDVLGGGQTGGADFIGQDLMTKDWYVWESKGTLGLTNGGAMARGRRQVATTLGPSPASNIHGYWSIARVGAASRGTEFTRQDPDPSGELAHLVESGGIGLVAPGSMAVHREWLSGLLGVQIGPMPAIDGAPRTIATSEGAIDCLYVVDEPVASVNGAEILFTLGLDVRAAQAWQDPDPDAILEYSRDPTPGADSDGLVAVSASDVEPPFTDFPTHTFGERGSREKLN